MIRIAGTYDDTEVYQHFSDTSYFMIYDVEGGKIVKNELISTGDVFHAALVLFPCRLWRRYAYLRRTWRKGFQAA